MAKVLRTLRQMASCGHGVPRRPGSECFERPVSLPPCACGQSHRALCWGLSWSLPLGDSVLRHRVLEGNHLRASWGIWNQESR